CIKKPLKKLLISLFCFLTITTRSYSQYFFYNDHYYDKDLLWEVGATLGLMEGITDVGSKTGSSLSPHTYDRKMLQKNFGLYVGASYKGIVEGRIEFTKGAIAGDDKNSNNAWIRNRNLSFRSNIFELSALGAIHPLALLNIQTPLAISPYLLTGIAYFSFYPKTFYNGQWIALRPLRTEGQAFAETHYKQQYSITQLALPVGIGIKYEISPKYNFRCEAIYRHTFTDYLDDVSGTYIDPGAFKNYFDPATAELAKTLSNRTLTHSTVSVVGTSRGNGSANDAYMSFTVKFGLVIGRKRVGG
ncbi:MAG: DUF6089 family protein, partial [Bacteroidota bacterium]|nr:DUF6089 family protein [Bacteroidota bacterium]